MKNRINSVKDIKPNTDLRLNLSVTHIVFYLDNRKIYAKLCRNI